MVGRLCAKARNWAARFLEDITKFLHCADVHLDSPMRGLARREAAPIDALRGAARRAFENLVNFAIKERVAFVVIAGDLYDGDRDDFNTAIFLQRQLRILREAGIDVVIALGNHDAANEITKRLDLPKGVHVFSHERPESVTLEAAGAVLHGQSYATRAVTDNLSINYPQAVPNCLNVGVLHTSLDGRPNHDPYAPATPESLARRGYEYWALGHVHKREEILREGSRIVFPGNLQGRDVGETGSKGATLVEYTDSGIQEMTHIELAPIQWGVVELDLRTATSPGDAIERASSRLAIDARQEPCELVATRLVLEMDSELAEKWTREAQRYEAQLRADTDRESLWIEKVKLKVEKRRSPSFEGEALEAIRAAISSLREDHEALGELTEVFAPLRSKLGSELGEVIRLSGAAIDPEGALALLDSVEVLLLSELGADS